LLGALAAAFTLIEDTRRCQQEGISVAAVDIAGGEIFLNPAAGLSENECRFVIAHELLHVGLRHDVRGEGRDPYLWNVACDYVINGWLVELGVGQIPAVGCLYDSTLKGESAETVYDRIVTDMRRFRRLATLRGVGLSDLLEPRDPCWWSRADGADLDCFYRECLGQGLDYHLGNGRGLLPAGLEEAIRALSQPPIPWDVALARWFDHYFAPLEQRRTYARPSRRQASTPTIPRPSYVSDPNQQDARTFGVLLDTSGSMSRELLGKALGAIASYSISHDVPAARVVFCDTVAYDAGYLPAEAIAGQVRVKGRGGTILQPGIDLLEHAADFPCDGPLLIITDGQCDRLRIRRDHAFLLPQGRSLPFVPRGPVFRLM
ncbi:MAG: peptidase, partial [Oscillochloris sp.]|nr:peptidase [Oscillochloris sp.]